MTENIAVALISSGAAFLTATVAFLVHSRTMAIGFEQMGKRMDLLERTVSQRFDRVEQRLDRIEADLKEFFRVLGEHDKRIGRLEDRK